MSQNKNLCVGIDLGTTYSLICKIDEYGNPEIIPNAEGKRLTPSAIFFDEESIVIGDLAKENAVIRPNDVVQFIKREIVNPNLFITYQNKRLSPIDISAIIIKKLKQDAEQYLGCQIKYAVITVPAYFDDPRRRATKQAGEIAGFKVLRTINEPTAAAIAFGYSKSKKDETVLVYDLGGGTFDVTIVRLENEGKDTRVLATDGDHLLGGKDFDDALIKHCVEHFVAQHGFDPSIDAAENQQLRIDVEKAKRELSLRLNATVLVRAKGLRTEVKISRDEFEKAIRPKLDTTLSLIRNVLQAASVKLNEIDRVILTGGSSRIPLVRQLVTDMFGFGPDISTNPDEVVSMGAAIVGSIELAKLPAEQVDQPIEEKIGGLQITDVISHSIGIEAIAPGSGQKINSILIKKNTPIPFDKSKEYTTTFHGQTGIKVTIYQGEFSNPVFCNPIGDFLLTGLPPGRPAGKKVRVTITCNTNGTVELSATDIESGVQTTTQVEYKSGTIAKQISAKKLWLQTQVLE